MVLCRKMSLRGKRSRSNGKTCVSRFGFYTGDLVGCYVC